MDLLPAIDLHSGRVVRLHQGDYDRSTTYGEDPVAQARAFEEAGCRWLHVVDLEGARSGRMRHLDVIGTIARETGLSVQVGGGVRTSGVIDRLISLGVARVVLGTAALRDWAWFEKLMGNPTYRGRLVLGLDARGGKLAVSGWEQQVEATPLEIARRVDAWPLAGIVYTDIATDGTLAGPNIAATRAMADATAVPVIASGGVGTLDDLRKLAQLPIAGVIVGRAIYEQRVDPAEAARLLHGDGATQ